MNFPNNPTTGQEFSIDQRTWRWDGLRWKTIKSAPTAHKSSHATGGTDALTPADIGAQPAGIDVQALPAPVVRLNRGFVNLHALAHTGEEGESFLLYNFPTVVCNNLPLSLQENTFVEIVIYKRYTREANLEGYIFQKRKRGFVVPRPHLTMPWGNTFKNRVPSAESKRINNNELINISMVRPNLYPAVHGTVINVYDYLNGRWSFAAVQYKSYQVVGPGDGPPPLPIEIWHTSANLLCPLPLARHTLSLDASKFFYAKNFAPLKFAFRYVHWANGEIFEGPMSKTYKIWYEKFPFRQNHYYSSVLGKSVSDIVLNPTHNLVCALA